jgi:hypothetical protein
MVNSDGNGGFISIEEGLAVYSCIIKSILSCMMFYV